MKVLIVNYNAYNEGGAGVSTYILAKALQSLGIDVYVASTASYPGIKTFIFQKFRFMPILQFRDVYLTNFLLKIIRKKNINIIHSAESRFTAISVAKAAQKSKIPFIMHYRSYWFCCLKGDLLFKNKQLCQGLNFIKCIKCCKKYRLLWEVYKFWYFKNKIKWLNQADVNIAISHTVANKLINARIIKNIKVIYNPITYNDAATAQTNLQKYKQNIINKAETTDPIIVTYVGRLIYHKGVNNFLKVAELISQRRKDIIFLLVGEGEMNKYCHDFIKNKKLNNIKLLGQIQIDKIDLIYNLSDIIFIPSILPEPFGRVIAEAMIYKKAVIASNIGGIKEIINHGINGLLVDPNNYQECMETIIYLADNDDIRKKLGESAYIRAKDFNDIQIAKSIIKLYKQALI